jgi:glycosyltransferase involved in cell wall biosynthesis
MESRSPFGKRRLASISKSSNIMIFVAKFYVSDSDLENLYSKALALLFLSECEGLGFPPLEAMRKSCPVVCNDTVELRDTSGETAFFVDTTQQGAVLAILEQMIGGKLTTEIDRKIPLGNERAMQFSGSNVVPRWLDVIEEIQRL